MSDILLVDDSAFARGRVRAVLVEAGYEVSEADSGKKCIEILSEDPPKGAVVLDLNMPEMDGFDVLLHLRKEGTSAQVIVCTADTQDATRQRCLELGAAHLINKPPKKDELLTAVKALLAEGAAER